MRRAGLARTDRLLRHAHSLGECIAHRGPVELCLRRERLDHGLVVVGRRNSHRNPAREGDQRNAVFRRQLGQELRERGVRSKEPSRPDVVCGHRPRRVDHQDDGRAVLCLRELGLRPGEAEEQQHEGPTEDGRRDVAPASRRARDHVRKQVGRRPARRFLRAVALDPEIRTDHDGDQQKQQEQPRRLERDVGRRSRAARPRRSPPRRRAA